MEEFGDNIITISDEDGNEYNLQHLDTMEYNGQYYMVFVPADISEDDERYGLLLMKSVEEDGESFLDVLSDEEEEVIYPLFMERLYGEEEEE